jgi:NADPH2:quinone reductase
LIEQRVRRAAKRARPRAFRPRPRQFRLERDDARVEFVNRQPVEVSLDQGGDHVVGSGAREFFIHAIAVDPGDVQVNIAAMTITSTMTAIDPAAPGGPEVLVPVTRPVPVAGPDAVLIRVHAAGINRPDVLQRLGRYPMPPGAPTIMGLEVAGEVVTAGGRWQVGDRVCALVAGGGYAEYCVAPAGQCLPIPDGLDFVAAAGLPETYFTVWSNLFERGRAVAGETILVHGGTSGIGTTAILLGKAFGLTVIVTAGSAAKCAAARGLGADHAIDYKASDFVDKVSGITGGKGVDVVLDMVGGDYLPRNLACLADDGRHVSIALQRGATAEVNFGLVMMRRLMLTGSMLRPRPVAFKTAIAAALEAKVWPLFASGKLRAVTDATFALADAADAHRRMEAGDHVGKIVLTV